MQMTGLTLPTYGTAYIDGMDLRKDMNAIHANIGVCPQHEYDTVITTHAQVSSPAYSCLKDIFSAVWCQLKPVNCVCSLLWETLTGREHLMFYGRMKNLTGFGLIKVDCNAYYFSLFAQLIIEFIFNWSWSLIQAVEESLKSVNLFHSGFGDKPVSMYSGGMKRRLSVAIALIGSPKV